MELNDLNMWCGYKEKLCLVCGGPKGPVDLDFRHTQDRPDTTEGKPLHQYFLEGSVVLDKDRMGIYLEGYHVYRLVGIKDEFGVYHCKASGPGWSVMARWVKLDKKTYIGTWAEGVYDCLFAIHLL